MTADRDRMSVACLMEDASAASGLTDWGDVTFSPTVELLIESCRATAALTPAGSEVLRKVCLRHLRNQLYLQEFVAARRDDARPPITSPIVITGLPRTGTTLLHNLLALDPAHRVLRFWEALHPVPPEAGSKQDRIRQAEVWLERLYALTPTFRAIHASTAEGPEECDALLQNSFASQHFDDMFRADSYSAWLNNAALADEYRYFARQLEVLSGPRDEHRRWVLKSPSHLGYLDTVDQTFPRVLIVHCHRDPAQALASYASLAFSVRAPHRHEISRHEVGTHVLNRCSIAIGRAMGARDRLGEDRFFDVGYASLVRDPLPIVRDLYAKVGRALSPEVTADMGRWVVDNPQHRHGNHDYTLAQFGLTSAEISAALGGYRQRFARQLA